MNKLKQINAPAAPAVDRENWAAAHHSANVRGRWRTLLLASIICAAVETSPAAEPTSIETLNKEALEVAGRVMQDFPDDPDAIALMGLVHSSSGDTAGAIKYWTHFLKRAPDRAEGYFFLGQIARQREENQQAVALFRKALEKEPKLARARRELAETLIDLGKTKEAITVLEQHISLSPRSGYAYSLLGQTYTQAKEYEKAKKNYTAAVEHLSDPAEAYHGLAVACAELGQSEKSREYMEQFKKLQPQQESEIDEEKGSDDLGDARQRAAKIHTSAGAVYLRHRYVWKAEKHWTRAATLDPKNSECRTRLATLYWQQKKLPEALRTYEQVVEADPKNAFGYLGIGGANQRMKHFPEAEKAFRKAIELAPQSSHGYIALAQLLMHTNRELDEAKTLVSEAVRLKPTARHYAILGKACEKVGDIIAARSHLDRAIQLDPDNPEYQRKRRALQQKR